MVCCGFIMGHGDHWRCVLPDLENGIADVLGWVSKGAVVGHVEYPFLQVPGGCLGATVSVIAWPTTGLRGTFVVVRDLRNGTAYLHTAYPAISVGNKQEIRIDSVYEISCGLEARISGVLGDASVTFFDPLYCLNRDRYRPGEVVDVALAGIAYSLRIVPHGKTRQTAVGTVPMDGAAILLPVRKNASEQNNGATGDE